MTKEQIERAYTEARRYKEISELYGDKRSEEDYRKDFVQIGMSMALNGEILYDEKGNIIRID